MPSQYTVLQARSPTAGAERDPFDVCILLVQAVVAVRPVRVVVQALEVGIHFPLLQDYTLLADDLLELGFASDYLRLEDDCTRCWSKMGDCYPPTTEESTLHNGVHWNLDSVCNFLRKADLGLGTVHQDLVDTDLGLW